MPHFSGVRPRRPADACAAAGPSRRWPRPRLRSRRWARGRGRCRAAAEGRRRPRRRALLRGGLLLQLLDLGVLLLQLPLELLLVLLQPLQSLLRGGRRSRSGELCAAAASERATARKAQATRSGRGAASKPGPRMVVT